VKKSYRGFCVGFTLALLGFLSGCATAERVKRVKTARQIEEDVEQLKETKADKADAHVKWDDLKTELQILSGKVEENQHFLREEKKKRNKHNERLDNMTAEYDKKILSLEETSHQNREALAELGRKLDALSEKLASFQAPKKNAAEERTDIRLDYIHGMKRYRQKDYDAAILMLKRYIGNFPSGRFIHNARFFLGDAYFQKKVCEDAILKYEEYKEKYPQGEKVAEALYKQGICFKAIGKKADAKLFLEELISSHGDSPYAKRAKVALKGL